MTDPYAQDTHDLNLVVHLAISLSESARSGVRILWLTAEVAGSSVVGNKLSNWWAKFQVGHHLFYKAEIA